LLRGLLVSQLPLGLLVSVHLVSLLIPFPMRRQHLPGRLALQQVFYQLHSLSYEGVVAAVGLRV
jgi:hypothetical protein